MANDTVVNQRDNGKLNFVKKINTFFIVSFCVLLILSFISLYSLKSLLNRSDWVNHTNNVLLKLENIISVLKDAETGQRGYLLTHNPEFLEPYIGSYHKVFESYNGVKELTIDNANQQIRLDTLKTLINDRFTNINSIIELENKGASSKALETVMNGEGKRIMDRIRRLITEMEKEELKLRESRILAVKTSSFITPFLILIFAVVALVISIFAFNTIRKNATMLIKSELNLTEANLRLEETFEELKVREEELRAFNQELEMRVEQRSNDVIAGLKKLEESEKKYKQIVESVKDYAIYMLDINGHIISWNSGAENLTGYFSSEIIGLSFSKFYPLNDQEKRISEEDLSHAKKTGRMEREGWWVRKDGKKYWANMIINPVMAEDGILIGYAIINRDLTERKRMEDELRRINTDLDTFVYTASHDLKAPIANLEGLLFTLSEEINDASTSHVSQLFVMMSSSVERLKHTIQELSDISKLNKVDELEIESVNMQELMHELIEDHRMEIKVANVKINLHFEQPYLQFSKKYLRSILENLLSNSIKYRSNDRDPIITIRTKEDYEWQFIEFSDNGLGIEEKNIDKIFSLYRRMHNHVPGTGVGLYIVKKIIENAGGRISVSSLLGKGTTFLIYLPKESEKQF